MPDTLNIDINKIGDFYDKRYGGQVEEVSPPIYSPQTPIADIEKFYDERYGVSGQSVAIQPAAIQTTVAKPPLLSASQPVTSPFISPGYNGDIYKRPIVPAMPEQPTIAQPATVQPTGLPAIPPAMPEATRITEPPMIPSQIERLSTMTRPIPIGEESQWIPGIRKMNELREEPLEISGAVGKGLVSGLTQIEASVGTGIQYIGGKAGIKTLENLGKKTEKYWENVGEKYLPPEELQGSILKNPALMGKGAWWAYNVAQMSPSFLAAYIPAAGTAKYLGILGKAVKLSPVVIARLARLGASLAGGVTGGALEGSHTYQEILNKGGTKDEAEAGAELMAIGSGALNALSLNVILKGMSPGWKSAILKYITSGTTEGLTEWLEEPWEGMVKMHLGHASLKDVVQQTKEGFNVFPIAAVTGVGGAALTQAIPSIKEVEPVAEPAVPMEEPVTPSAELAPAPEQIAKPEAPVKIEPTPEGIQITPTIPESKAKKLTFKQQYDYLLSEIDTAVEQAPEEYSEAVGKVSIEVPDDGVFTIWNDKKSLNKFKEIVAKKFPKTKATRLTKAKPPKAEPKLKPLGKRIKGATNVEYYNEFRPRKQDVITALGYGNVYQDGYYSDGNYMIMTDKKPALKGVGTTYRSDVEEGRIKGLIDKVESVPSELIGEFYTMNMLDPDPALAHVVTENNEHYKLNAHLVDVILTKYPDAKTSTVTIEIGEKTDTMPGLTLFTSENKRVGLVMPIKDTDVERPSGKIEELGDIVTKRYPEVTGKEIAPSKPLPITEEVLPVEKPTLPITEKPEVPAPKVEPIEPVVGKAEKAKEPWEMTRDEWIVDSNVTIEEQLGLRPGYPRIVKTESPVFYNQEDAEKWKDDNKITTGYLDVYQENSESPKEWKWVTSDDIHKNIIRKALSEGKPVPTEVLADYPDLKAPSVIKPKAKPVAKPVKPIEKITEPPIAKKLTSEQRTYVQNKIRELGTMDAVLKKYHTPINIDKYARVIAPQILVKEKVVEPEVKLVEKITEPPIAKKLTSEEISFVKDKVRKLGTIDAVFKAYNTTSDIDKYARAIAPKLLGKKAVGKPTELPKEKLPIAKIKVEPAIKLKARPPVPKAYTYSELVKLPNTEPSAANLKVGSQLVNINNVTWTVEKIDKPSDKPYDWLYHVKASTTGQTIKRSVALLRKGHKLVPETAALSTQEQKAKIHIIARDKGMPNADYVSLAKEVTGKPSSALMTQDEATKFIDRLTKWTKLEAKLPIKRFPKHRYDKLVRDPNTKITSSNVQIGTRLLNINNTTWIVEKISKPTPITDDWIYYIKNVSTGKTVSRLLNVLKKTYRVILRFAKEEKGAITLGPKPRFKTAPRFKKKLEQIDLFKGKITVGELTEDLVDDYLADRDDWIQEGKSEAARLQDRIKKVIGSKHYGETEKKLDKAMQVYIDLKGKVKEQIKKYGGELTNEQNELLEMSQNLTSEQKQIAEDIIASNNATGLKSMEAGIIGNVVENYTMRLWKQTAKEKQEASIHRKFGKTTTRAKHRTLDSILHGWSLGKELRVEGATTALSTMREEIAKTKADREMFELAKQLDLISHIQHEGWKLVEHPNFTDWVFANKLNEEEVHGRNFLTTDKGVVLERRPMYAEPVLAKRLNNILGKSKLYDVPGIKGLTRAGAEIKHTIFTLSTFHHQAITRSYMLGGKVGLKTANPVKAFREGIEAIKSYTPEVQELVRGGLTLGRIQDWDEVGWTDERTRIGKIVDRIPGAGKVKGKVLKFRDMQTHFLFNVYLPGLKAQAGLLEYARLLRKYDTEIASGEMTRHDVAKMVGNLINDDFGQLHLQRMRRNPTAQHIFRLLALAPDWTESNVRTMVKAFKGGKEASLYRRFWTRIAVRGLATTILFNFLISLADDDDFLERYRKAWKAGHLRWLDLDITPLYKMLGGKSERRKYLSLIGHFHDPIKFATHLIRSAKHKASPIAGMILELLTGTDWAGRNFTTFPELLGFDDKGVYKTTRKGKYKKGDPKGGKLKGKTVAYTFGVRGGPIGYTQIPSYVINQARGVAPIPVQNAIAWLHGEMDAWDAMLKSLGFITSQSYPEDITSVHFKKLVNAVKRKDKKGAKFQHEKLKEIGFTKEQFFRNLNSLGDTISPETRKLLIEAVSE